MNIFCLYEYIGLPIRQHLLLLSCSRKNYKTVTNLFRNASKYALPVCQFGEKFTYFPVKITGK